MARILICHVPKDGATARELGAALMGRDHFVSFDGEPDTPRADRATRLRQFEAVVVIWTETSAHSAGLAEIARNSLPLNALVPVRAEELDKTKLPLAFRKLNMFAPREVDGISRLVARFSTAATSLKTMAEASARLAAAPRDETRPLKPVRTRDPRAGAPQNLRAGTPQKAPLSTTPAQQTKAAPPTGPRAPAAIPATAARPHVIEPGTAATVAARPLLDLPEVPEDLPADRPEAPLGDPLAAPAPPKTAEPASPSRAEGLEAALKPRRLPPPPAVTAADLARVIDDGLLRFRIPEAMWLGKPVTVEIAVDQDALAELLGAPAPGEQPSPDYSAIETLSVSLYGHAEVFEIERRTERTQLMAVAEFDAMPASQTPHGRWVWVVTPQSGGPHDLIVRVAALLRDRNGVPEPVAVPDRRFQTVIDVPEGADLLSGLVGWERSS